MKKKNRSLLKRGWILPVLLCSLLLIDGYLTVSRGSWEIPDGEVVKILLKNIGLHSGPVDEVENTIVWDGRMPRFLVALLVGFALAAAGAVMQGVFKNPMASPGVIGISSGAALGAVLALYLGLSAHSLFLLPLSAILFSLISLAAVFTIATSRGYTSVPTLLLAGIALNLIFGALSSFVITLSTREFDAGRVIVTWLMGDLNNRTWDHVYIVAATTCLGLLGILFFVKDLNILMLGEESAENLGVDVPRARNVLLLCASVQTGGAISVAGVIGFVGLLAPHMMRSMVGPDNRRLVPLAGLLGAVFVVYADLFVRLVVKADLRVGVLTSLMGGPFFLYLIVRYRKRFEYL
jgi:iron complex transport system permease protein